MIGFAGRTSGVGDSGVRLAIGADFAAELVEHIYGTDDLPAAELVIPRVTPRTHDDEVLAVLEQLAAA